MPTTTQEKSVLSSVHLPLLRDMFPKTLNISVSDAAGVIGWQCGSLKNELARPHPILRSVKIGRRRMVPLVDLARYLDGLSTATTPPKSMGRPRKGGGQ